MSFLLIQEKKPSSFQVRNSEVVIDAKQGRVVKNKFGAPEKLLQNFENVVESGQAPVELQEAVRAFFEERQTQTPATFYVAYPKPV